MKYKVIMSNVYHVEAEDEAEAKEKVLNDLIDSGGYNLIVSTVDDKGYNQVVSSEFATCIRHKAVKEIATWAAESAFQSLSDAFGDDNAVTTNYNSGLSEAALDSFKANSTSWSEEEIDLADSIISNRIWELTTVAE